MPSNALVAGPPRSGKTTALERTVSRLRDRGVAVGGLASPELRAHGDRVGFDLVDLATDRREPMARVEYDGPSVGKYGVDVDAIDRRSETAIGSAIEAADCVVIDEIAPMQCLSDRFVRETRRALDSRTPVIAAIAVHDSPAFLQTVRSRDDATTFAADPETRDALPDRLVEWVRSD